MFHFPFVFQKQKFAIPRLKINWKLAIACLRRRGNWKIVLVVLVFTLLPFHLFTSTFAEPNCDSPGSGDFDYCLQKIQSEIDSLSSAHENNKTNLANLKSQYASLGKKIDALSGQLKTLEGDIEKREEDLAYTKQVFEAKANNHYKFLRLYDPILPFLASEDASDALREFNFRLRASDEDRKEMEKFAGELIALKNDRDNLEKNKESLAGARASVNSQAKFLEGEVAKVETYLNELSAKQQEILAAKAGSFITSVGDSELADDYYASIKGFREGAPGGSFAVFSFGAYTHRKGMSQYGARGRAQAGQNYKQILQAYYGKEPVGKDTGGTISVAGYGNLDFESTYLYGIAEMPSDWNPEALKVQAVAARTFAYRYKTQGSTICTTEACQVFRKSKSDSPPAAWKAAVDATRGQVLEDVTTFYSSTTGGYIPAVGWDTTDGGGGSNFFEKSYENLGGSPWAYKAWYRQGYTSSGATCGKGNPWLTGAELADIVNAALALKNGGADTSRITPVTTSCWGGNPYSYDDLRNAVSGGIPSVSSVSVLQGNGETNEVVINGNIHLSGAEFKRAYNIRASGYMRIPQGSGFGSSTDFAFFNIEHK